MIFLIIYFINVFCELLQQQVNYQKHTENEIEEILVRFS